MRHGKLTQLKLTNNNNNLTFLNLTDFTIIKIHNDELKEKLEFAPNGIFWYIDLTEVRVTIV